MDYANQPFTPAGADLVADAERLAMVFAERAAIHDSEGSFSFANSDDLREAGFYGAPVPVELGGRGVESVHDILVATSRLARGDASTTIALNMHLNATIKMARNYRRAVAEGNKRKAMRLAGNLSAIAAGEMIISSCATEAGTDLTEPNTRATPVGECWEISGTKIFCTGSPAATHIAVTAAYFDDEGVERIGFGVIPVNLPGITMNNDWDALGMRSSGSQSITFDRVRIPKQTLNGGYRLGSWSDALMDTYLTAGLFHSAPSLGIAETAASTATKMAAKMKKGRSGRPIAERPVIQQLAAENAMDVAAMRAMFSRASLLVEQYYATSNGNPSAGCIREVFAEVQCAKSFMNQAGVRVVDRALTMSGGAGFMTKHPLSRLYRDARAGGFMHPLAANTAAEFVGRISLGLEPEAA